MPLVQRRSASDDDDRPARNPRPVPVADEDEDERPARRRATEPAFKAPKRAHDDDDDLPDEDEDERPRSRSGGSSSDAVKSGWGAAKRLKEEGGDYASEFKFDSGPQLVKFLSDAPFAVYRQHWIEGLRSTKKRSFICLGKGCPLCAPPVSHKADKKWAFNIAVIDEDGEAEAKALIAGPRLFEDIVAEHESNGGLEEGFYVLSRTGKKATTAHKVKHVKNRDLEEDWKITPEDAEDAMRGLEIYGADQFKASTKSYLQEIADELADVDD